MTQQYRNYMEHIMLHGVDKSDRTGTGTRSVFGYQMRFDLTLGFPLLTMKRVPFKPVAIVLLWFLKGLTNVRWLQERGVTIWDEWADENGDLGPVYGSQWRSWPTDEIVSVQRHEGGARGLGCGRVRGLVRFGHAALSCIGPHGWRSWEPDVGGG